MSTMDEKTVDAQTVDASTPLSPTGNLSASGSAKEISISITRVCTECKGDGWIEMPHFNKCETCAGTGGCT